MKQANVSDLEYNNRKKQSKREKFINEMERVIPWKLLLEHIRPFSYTSSKPGRQPIGLGTMLRIYVLQQWYTISYLAAETPLSDSYSMRKFVGVWIDQIPEATIIHVALSTKKHSGRRDSRMSSTKKGINGTLA